MDFIAPGMKRKLAARQRNSLNNDDDFDTSTKRELQKILKPTECEITNFIVNFPKHPESLPSSLIIAMYTCQPVNFLTIQNP